MEPAKNTSGSPWTSIRPSSATTPKTLEHECETCGFKTDSVSSLDKHREAHTLMIRRRNCVDCDFTTDSYAALKKHVKREHPNRVTPYVCQTCDFVANNLSDFRRHKVEVHRTKEIMAASMGEFKCDQCWWSAPTERKLKKHIWKHSGEKTHKCPHCDYVTSTSFHLVNHVVTHQEEKPFQCECGKAFKTKRFLKNHAKIHEKSRRHKCTECDYACLKMDNLKTHLKRHFPDAEVYVCSQCKHYTIDLKEFEAHLLTHARDTLVECPLCDYACTSEATLKNHTEREHKPKKRSRCVVCNGTFADPAELKAHAETHKESKMFHCAKCGFTTTRNASYREHVKEHILDESGDVEGVLTFRWPGKTKRVVQRQIVKKLVIKPKEKTTSVVVKQEINMEPVVVKQEPDETGVPVVKEEPLEFKGDFGTLRLYEPESFVKMEADID